MDSPSALFQELKRRSVFKVAAAYTVAAWLLAQVASIVFPAFELPEWWMRLTLIALAAGFPVACVLAWAYELTSEGLRRDDGARPSADPAPAASPFERLASWEVLLVVGALALAVVGGLMSTYGRSAAAPHLAVLPFRVVSAEPEAGVLAAGLVETITSTVTQFGQFDETLWVVPASEVSDGMTPSDARQRFGVSLVVSGSIQFDAERIRLTLNLIDAATERQLRSRQLDVEKRSLIDLQDEATRHLARMLDLRLSDAEASLLTRGLTDDPDAGRLYVKGRGVLRQGTSMADVDEAVALFEQALAADSSFALASAGLGEAYWQKYRRTDDVRWVDPALRHSRRSLALDSTLAPAWVTLGIIRGGQRHDAAAVEAFEEALALDPSHPDARLHLATVHRRQGAWDRAEATYRQAIARQPEYWKGYNLLGAFYYARGQHEDAIAQYRHGLRLAPANPALLNNVAVAYWQLERLGEAVEMFERILALDATRTSAQFNLATAYFYLGRYDEAAALYQAVAEASPADHSLAGALADAQSWSTGARALAPASYRRAIGLAEEHLAVRGQDPLLLSSLAQYHARLGGPDSARLWLQRAEALVDSSAAPVVLAFGLGELYESLGERERAWPWMRYALRRDYGWIQVQHSPWLADLRTDPRVRRLLDARQRDAP